MRTMRDIDLLVEEASFLKIINLMLLNGYYFKFKKTKLEKLTLTTPIRHHL